MDPQKASLLFGDVPPWADLDDREDRATLLAERLAIPDDASSGQIVRLMLYETVATQIAEENPPEVWATARRLMVRGMESDQVLANLVIALEPSIHRSITDERPFDLAAYAAALGHLPLPTPAETETTMVAVTREQQPIPIDDLERLTGELLGFAHEEEPFWSLLDEVSDQIMDPDGPLVLLAGDLVVEPESLCSGIVLTHQINEAERELGVLTVSVDLVGFVRTEASVLGDDADELETFSAEEGHLAWRGPKDWLDRFDVGDHVSVRMIDGSVVIESIEPPVLDDALVADLRGVYDRAVDEPGLPVSTEELLLGLLAEERGRFLVPQAPLRDLIEAAGLELRGSEVAHDPEIWENMAMHGRIFRVAARLDDRDDVAAALDILGMFDDGEDDPARLRGAATRMRDHEFLDVVTDEMVGPDDDHQLAENTLAFGERLTGAARRPGEVATSHWLAAVANERLGDLLAAEAHLRRAVEADPGWGPATDRLAWYLSDRGLAADAARLWRNLGIDPTRNKDLRIIEPFARPESAKLGRNDPCWCGSGRKHKHCHLNQPARAPLPERVGWLWRKAAAYLERRGGAAGEKVFDLAWIRAGGQGDTRAFEGALSDPLTVDLVLTEGGWFRRFLSDRGSLLPDDEALLAASWVLVDRSVYEILSVRPGLDLTLRDLRTAEEVEVREHTFSQQAVPGTVICARPVPDGKSRQFVGGLLPVHPGREAELLDLLDEGEPEMLAEYIGGLERPPRLVTRENEPLVLCKAVLAIGLPDGAREILDARYEASEPDTWVEMHELSPGDSILRATLHLSGSQLRVETMSETRMDRALARLSTELPDAELLSDERRPLRPGEMPPIPDHMAAPSLGAADLTEASAQIQERVERRWCDESVPALGGLTPREAAADPTRREPLERLLVQFEQTDRLTPDTVIAMRPDRLRELLGLRQ
jgi:hypothetical protein